MKKLLLAPALLCTALGAHAQLALQNFNSAGMPAGWSMIKADAHVISSGLVPAIISGLGANAWMKWPTATTGDSIMITTSLFTPSGTADRWLITPSFNVTSTDMMLSWYDEQAYSATGGSDQLEIWVSTTGGATTADFTTKIGITNTTSSSLVKKMVSLGAFNGSSIRVAFRCHSTNTGVVGLDNVQTEILAAKPADLQLTAVTPTMNTLSMFGQIGGTPLTVAGTVQNNGTSTVSSYKINYQLGSGTVVSQTISDAIIYTGTSSFTFTTPVSVTSATQTGLKIWIDMTGDATRSNDTITSAVVGYNTKPAKKILVEEGTGTWCGFCVRGLVYMDSIYKAHPDNFSLVAVHNSTSDPMQVPAYDSYVSSMIGGRYPNAAFDRSIVEDPSVVFDYYDYAKDQFGVADIAMTANYTGTTFQSKVTVTPKANVNFACKLALILTEDAVSGTATGYTQHNYYSDAYLASIGAPAGYYGPLKGIGIDFNAAPYLITGIPFDFVARGIYPSPTGETTSLPTTLTAGTTYNYTFPAVTMSSDWKPANMKAVVALINANDNTVLNSQNAKLVSGSAINDVASGLSQLNVYPNPASEVLTASFSLTETSNVTIQVLDVTGRTVASVPAQDMTPGAYQVPVNISSLNAGTYMVKIMTDKGNLTQRVSVIK